MPNLKRIKLPSGSVYDLVDQGARDLIAALEGATTWLGVTTTPLFDNSETNPIIIDGTSVTAKAGSMAAYGREEFIFTGTKWQAFGDLSMLGQLAYADYATGSFTPKGTVSTPEINIEFLNDDIYPLESRGTLPGLFLTVQNETLNVSWDSGTLPRLGDPVSVVTGVYSITSSTPTFTGTADNIYVEPLEPQTDDNSDTPVTPQGE